MGVDIQWDLLTQPGPVTNMVKQWKAKCLPRGEYENQNPTPGKKL